MQISGRWMVQGTCGFLLGMALMPASAGEESPAVPKAARWVSPEAPIYLEVARPDALIDRLADEQFRNLLRAVPGYEKALEGGPFQKLRAAATLVADQLETTPEKAARDLIGGGLVLAVEGQDRLFLAVTPTDPAFLDRAHARLVAMARQDATEKQKPDPVQEREHRGIKEYSVHEKEAHAIINGVLVVATGWGMLDQVIDRALAEPGVPGLIENDDWKARRASVPADSSAWAFVRLDRLRELDPSRFQGSDPPDAGQTILFGPWLASLRSGRWASASLTWTGEKLASEVAVSAPEGGYSEAMTRFQPPSGQGAPARLSPPGTILSVSLWRDLAALWEVRDQLLPTEALQGLAQLDTTAGTFFGGRDFGTGVLGALTPDWRLVLTRQDLATLDPVPDVKLPAFALVLGLDPEDEEFAQRLKAAFQSFIGLANLGAAQTKAPPLMIGSEEFQGVTIATSRYLTPKEGPAKGEPVDQRYNFSPSSAQVKDQFVIGSSLGVTRDLVASLKQDAASSSSATLAAEADGAELAALIDQNRERLVRQNMLEKGNDREQAEAAVGLLASLARFLNRGTLAVEDTTEGPRVRLEFHLRP